MFKPRLWLNVCLVAMIALLAVAPAAVFAAPPSSDEASISATTSDAPSGWGLCSYRVRWGDTLAKIAWQHHTSVSYLKFTNRIPNVNRIYAGQWLKVPCAGR